MAIDKYITEIDLINMPLHETIEVLDDRVGTILIMKVFGGWIYRFGKSGAYTRVFVPCQQTVKFENFNPLYKMHS